MQPNRKRKSLSPSLDGDYEEGAALAHERDKMKRIKRKRPSVTPALPGAPPPPPPSMYPYGAPAYPPQYMAPPPTPYMPLPPVLDDVPREYLLQHKKFLEDQLKRIKAHLDEEDEDEPGYLPPPHQAHYYQPPPYGYPQPYYHQAQYPYGAPPQMPPPPTQMQPPAPKARRTEDPVMTSPRISAPPAPVIPVVAEAPVPAPSPAPTRVMSRPIKQVPPRVLPDKNRFRPTEAYKFATQVTRRLRENRSAAPFLEPVDPIALGIPDYPSIVKHPMDLGTIRNRLETYFYTTLDEWASDVRLVFSNCRLFNAPDSPIIAMCARLEEVFTSRWEQRPLSTQMQSEVDSTMAPAPSPAPAPKPRASHPAPAPAPFVKKEELLEMTEQEKYDLGVNINQLSQEKLQKVVEIISAVQSLGQAEDEVEIDLDALDTATLRKLESYVNGCLAEVAASAPPPAPAVAAVSAPAPTPYQAPPAPVPAPAMPNHLIPVAPAPVVTQEGSESHSSSGSESASGDHDAPAPTAGSTDQLAEGATQTTEPKKEVSISNVASWHHLADDSAPAPVEPAATAAVPLWSEFQNKNSEKERLEKERLALEQQQRQERQEREQRRREEEQVRNAQLLTSLHKEETDVDEMRRLEKLRREQLAASVQRVAGAVDDDVQFEDQPTAEAEPQPTAMADD
eukprot:TRINITY_DN1193_c1_g1_i3.p1 TRINITY_DN1193_c1_g1~~TRINITY_DN1193_c1_g1_i3.p1  ORF type:complete len:677 (+),score=112.63 TRINITY_DN1193_c1_g1_i3:77-2107(+)